MYSDRRGYGRILPRTKPSRQKPSRTIEREFVQGAFVRIFVVGLLKVGGSRCMTYFRGVPGCMTKCDRGRGSKLAKNSVTYFMELYSGKSLLMCFLYLLRIFSYANIGGGRRLLGYCKRGRHSEKFGNH